MVRNRSKTAQVWNCIVLTPVAVAVLDQQHLFPPGPVLHVSNITGGVAAGEEIETILKQHCVGGKLAEPLRYFEQVRST